MTTRNFDALFAPKAIVLVGASNQPGSIGDVLARNLLTGEFRGPVMTVNPHEAAIRSTLNYRSIEALPLTPDLAIIATPAATVPGLIKALADRGCRAAVIISAGFGEGGDVSAAALKQAVFDAARPKTMRILGPNCLGLLQPALGLNASFSHLPAPGGDIAFVSQSGAIATTVIDWAAGGGLGFSHIVTMGDMIDVDFGDMLDHLAQDRATHAILLYVEQITAARKFMSAARIAARFKPVVVIKAGRSARGAQAAASHTGALAGADAVYDAAFRRAGCLRVTELAEAFDAARTLALTPGGVEDGLFIITNGGGLGVMAVDALGDRPDAPLASLDDELKEMLNSALPAAWSHGNPIDILGDADAWRYQAALSATTKTASRKPILVLNCPTGVADRDRAAETVIAFKAQNPDQPLLTSWVGETTAKAARQRFEASAIPSYATPEDAIRAYGHLIDHRQSRRQLLEAPGAGISISSEIRDAARTLITAVQAQGRSVLTGPEAKKLLSLYGVPAGLSRTARTPADVGAVSQEIGGPVAVKILSPDITHKSDVGGVALDIASGADAEAAATVMLERVEKAAPTAWLQGFTVEPMVRRSMAHELLVGVSTDKTFGPMLMVGAGGTAVEVLADVVMGLPPLNRLLAHDMISRTAVSRLLRGYRDVAPAKTEAVADVLVRLSDMVIDLDQVVQLDINPLLVDADGVLALDARVVISPPGERAPPAITPYPIDLEGVLAAGADTYPVRPVRPDDASRLVNLIEETSPVDRRLRFFGSLRDLPHDLAARLSQIDYQREMALVALDPTDPDRLAGVVRLLLDPNEEHGEFAVLVHSDLKGHGLGHALMTWMLDYGRRRGLKAVSGDVLAENSVMLELSQALGGVVEPRGDDPSVRIVRFTL
jgi:acetyltransferase